MVFPPLEGFGQPCRDDPDCIASHGIGNEQQTAFHHSKRDETLLALVLVIINPIEGKRVFKNVPCGLERDAMLDVILCGLGIVPLEPPSFINVRLSRSIVKRLGRCHIRFHTRQYPITPDFLTN
jgi:hypothetical protein